MRPAATSTSPAVASSPSGAAGPIEFFFDYHSPWCWFASLRLVPLAARLGREVIWKPMHLAKLIERIGGRRPLEANAAFVRWFKSDMHDWAARLGVDFRYHPEFPLRPARALRATVFAAQHGKAADFTLAVMRAYWSEARDISDAQQLAALGEAVGLDAQGVRASIDDPACKQLVERNTEEARERGVFGAPSLFCDGKLFWGNDRLEMLEEFALGHIAPHQPQGATRP